MAYAAEQLQDDLGLRGLASMLVRAKINAHTENNFWMTVDADIESGGVFVATDEPLEPGMVVIVQIRLGAATDVIEAIASVSWSRPFPLVGPRGYGLQFLDVDRVSMARIRRFMHHVRDPILYDD